MNRNIKEEIWYDEDAGNRLHDEDEDVEEDEDDENPLRIDEPSEPGRLSPEELNDENEPMQDTIVLDRLPRPVNELNCRQARTYLVKLLRTANGGQNPHYGNPEMKPAFWPDYYWPWTKLTDVHTKPRGMNEPLQYSEMMKLAISRGYQYFGYDPNTYIDPKLEDKSSNVATTSSSSLTSSSSSQYRLVSIPAVSTSANEPPRLFRPLSRMNCVHARTILAKLLRYQQLGNNPVYGSPDTRPPWWPDECIRWVDMVDLRGKPPYLPESKSYTDVLKIAIERAYKYYGVDPETYLEPSTNANEETMTSPSSSSNPCSSPSSSKVALTDKQVNLPRVPLFDGIEQAQSAGVKHLKLMGPPPKLPIPVSKLNCGGARTALSRLLRYQAGNQPPNYGNPLFMPVWWPNDIIDWSQIKNLSHRYEGYLGNSYSNCLRISLIRGYAYYGYDANEFVEDPNGGSGSVIHSLESSELPKISNVRSRKPRKPMPCLVPIENLPPDSTRIDNDVTISPKVLSSLKTCKVQLNRKTVPTSASLRGQKVLYPERPEIVNVLYDDYLNERLYVDTEVVSSSGEVILTHSMILGAHSPQMKELLTVNHCCSCKHRIIFPDLESGVLKILIKALYTGEVLLKDTQAFDEGLALFRQMGMLLNLLPSLTESRNEKKDKENMSPSVSIEEEIEEYEEEEEDFTFEPSEAEKDMEEAEANFDDIIDAVATEIEEEQQQQQKQEQVDKKPQRRSVRHRRKKDMPDFELNAKSLDDESGDEEVKHATRRKTTSLKDNEEKEGEKEVIRVESPITVKLEVVEKDELIPRKSLRTKQSSRKRVSKKDETASPPCSPSPSSTSSSTSSPSKRCKTSSSTLVVTANKPDIDAVTEAILNEKVKEGARPFCEFLMQSGFLCKEPPKCDVCGVECSLTDESQNLDGVVWRCLTKGEHCEKDLSVRKHSIFESSSESLCWIMKIILCWSDNTSLTQCHQTNGADIDKIFYWYDKCRDYFGTLQQRE